MSSHCGKPAASLTPFMAFICVLDPGHEGECRPGGVCVTHGPYTGEPNQVPICPQWPKCAEAAGIMPETGGL